MDKLNDLVEPIFKPLSDLLKPYIELSPMNLFLITLVLLALIYYNYDKITNTMKNNNLMGGGEITTFTLYYVEWCPHCKVIKPEWKKLENDNDLKHIKIEKINCEENESIVEEKNIEGFPTILLNTNGKEVAYNGERTYAEFKNYLVNL